MKNRYFLVLPPLLLVKSPVAADMYCDVNTKPEAVDDEK